MGKVWMRSVFKKIINKLDVEGRMIQVRPT